MIRMGPGRKLICIPDSGVTVLSPGGGAAAANWWDPDGSIGAANVAGVWQAKGAASLAASYLRLAGDQGYSNIDPAAVGGVAPTWASATGWVFNGSTQYLNTGVVPAASYSMIVKFSGVIANQINKLAGSAGTTSCRFLLSSNISTNVCVYQYANGAMQIAPSMAAGTLAVSPDAGYRDGILNTTFVGTAWSGSPTQIYIGATNELSVQYGQCNIQSIAIYKTTLTAPQVALVSAAMGSL